VRDLNIKHKYTLLSFKLNVQKMGIGMYILPQLLPTYPTYPTPAITFVLHDTGETGALAPVMQKLDSQGVDYSISADGTARSLVAGNPHLAPTQQEVSAAQQTNPRLALWMQQRLIRATQAKVCVTGLVSDFQKQWAAFFRQSGRRVVGYYDGFRVNLNPQQNSVNAFQGVLSDLITPSQDTAAYFQGNGFGNIPVSVLGQPSLESISQTIQQVHPTALAQQLGVKTGQLTLLFVGQYGPGYEQAFQLFCQTAQHLPNANLLVSLHPNVEVDGSLERNLLQQYGLQNRVRVIPKTISTAQVLPLADAVLTLHSTMATQAFLQGKKVIFVGQDRFDAFEPLQARGLAPRCLTPLSLIQTINNTLQPNQIVSAQSQKSFYQILGIPTQASGRISNYLMNLTSASGFND
jgi:hypothetical protein